MKKRSKTGMSNIDIVKNYLSGTRPFLQIGYTDDLKERKDGEMWQSANGQTWIFKDGVKKAISKPTKFIDLVRLQCGDCKKNMKLFNNRLDDKIFPKTGRCIDCQIKFEDNLKRLGKYDVYEKLKIFNNQKSFCVSLKDKLEETIRYLESSDNKIKYMNEDGSQEYWTDTNREKILDGARKELKECLQALDDINQQLFLLTDK